MSTIVNVSEAKMHLSRLLEDVAAGGEVVITKYGEPVARLSPDELADFEGYRRFVAKV